MTFPDYSDSVDVAALQAAIEEMLSAKSQSGSQLVTTNASGNAVISHDLGRTPDFVGITLAANTVRAAVTVRTASNFTVNIVSASTGSAFVGSTTVMWEVS